MRRSDLSPTGYRIDPQRRLDLQSAQLALGKDSLQAVIDHAVTQLLTGLETNTEYKEISRAARRAQRKRSE
ncbi:hypothetical protein [Nocardioides halotolerans]|jgi:hypothetical protein|uniref:hypothetical protein n=1 Tax=Nocardioides halotolerans TaxID=433660 RepID=UPI00041F8EA6|nr:hypothetical protein [Nocardioides halotolerans]